LKGISLFDEHFLTTIDETTDLNFSQRCEDKKFRVCQPTGEQERPPVADTSSTAGDFNAGRSDIAAEPSVARNNNNGMSTEEQQRPPVINDIDNRAIGEKLAELTELMASFEEVGALDRAPEEGSAGATGERATQMDAATGEGDVHREVPPELTTR
jgi:hypothetical protein